MGKNDKFISTLWLILGSIVFLFTRTGKYVPLAIIISSILLLRFLRYQRTGKGILFLWLGLSIVMIVQVWGPPEKDKLLYFGFTLTSSIYKGLILGLPFYADRLLYKRYKGFLSTFVFPISATALYFAASNWSGLFEGVAIFFSYTQFGDTSLIQGLSLAGIWGMIFFISWFASVFNWIWEENFEWEIVKKGTIIFLLIGILLLSFGGIKNSPIYHDYEGRQVKIAAITVPYDEENANPNLLHIYENREFNDFKKKLNIIRQKTKIAAQANTKIVVFQECSIIIHEHEKDALNDSLKSIAQDFNIYLCLNYVYFPKLHEGEHEYALGMMQLSDEEEGRNISVFINNEGEILTEYMKHNLVIAEDNYVLHGPGEPKTFETEYGEIGIVTCKDLEFPSYIRRIRTADIVLAPSFEAYKCLAITYNQMLRAVEFGFSFVRACGNGLSIAVDYNGNILAQQNTFTSEDGIMLADVPINGKTTIYGTIGDLFAWLCVIGLFLLALLPVFKRENKYS